MAPEAPASCPGCGREYPSGRFAGGRSLQCACGQRVGRTLRTGLLSGTAEPRFMVDSMLGGLARHLRALGYDAAWEPEIADPELVRRGVEEGRIVLTRDRRLAEEWWVEGLLLLRREDPHEQLREVAETVPLDTSRIFSRCTRCNRALHPLSPESLPPGRVPAAVRARQDEFLHCPGCERVYWEGGHTARMRRALEHALPRDDAAKESPPGGR